ncbi:MAG: hypothetical protein C0502_08205 [Opitutus sp.]|nr:hypothetical protein [Opitutus sp.]
MHVAPVNPHAGLLPAEMSSPARLAQLGAAEQAKAVAGQFEAILLRQFLQESVGSIMGGKEGGAASGIYGYLLTDVLATRLSQGGGLGLGHILQHQLAPRGSPAAVTAATGENRP